MKKKLILLGGGGHCKSVIGVIEKLSNYCVFGILDSNSITEQKKNILGYPILGGDEKIEFFIKKSEFQFVITVGQIKNSNKRRELYELVKSKGGKLPTIVSPTAIVSIHSKFQEGTVIMNFATVNCNTKIGKCNIINTQVNIEHDCEIGDFNHISTGVIVNGNVKIGSNVFIGSKSAIINDCRIGNNIVIGMGSTVLNNIPDNHMFYQKLNSVKLERLG